MPSEAKTITTAAAKEKKRKQSTALNERNGSSLQVIEKYIGRNYKCDVGKIARLERIGRLSSPRERDKTPRSLAAGVAVLTVPSSDEVCLEAAAFGASDNEQDDAKSTHSKQSIDDQQQQEEEDEARDDKNESADQKLDIIKATGARANIGEAKIAIAKRIEELEADRKSTI
ncbi:histone H1.3-like [Aedes aegypti]|uniref:Uncharacterized protein n=1 Tax=Aedes aegypti TaxID=7159 RepID=A0A6I8U7R2_AEDAE|nr:histone H1.3-like [Aedes aegypti]